MGEENLVNSTSQPFKRCQNDNTMESNDHEDETLQPISLGDRLIPWITRMSSFHLGNGSSWKLETHPMFFFGNDSKRKQMREMYAEDSLTVDRCDNIDCDDEIDDEDMVYGIDPEFSDIDEELRATEGIISEHTIFKEIEVDEENESTTKNSADENVHAVHKKLCINKAKSLNSSANSIDNYKKKTVPTSSVGLNQFPPKQSQSTSAVECRRNEIIHTIANSSEDVSIPHSVPLACESQTQTLQIAANFKYTKSIEEDTKTKSESETLHATDAKSDGFDNYSIKSVEYEPQSNSGSHCKKSRLVRLVELPDYLATVAKEHQRQLLEKRRRDLMIAAQAANDRDQAVAAVNEPRNENMIRRGYFERLGIPGDYAPVSIGSPDNPRNGVDMGIYARRAAIASARTRRQPPSMRSRLQPLAASTKNRSLFKKITSWMSQDTNSGNSPNSPNESKEKPRRYDNHLIRCSSSYNGSELRSFLNNPASPASVKRQFNFDFFKNSFSSGSTSHSQDARTLDEPEKRVAFVESVDVYFIPMRNDYPVKVKHAVWHSRSAFLEMVLTNMETLEEEIHEESNANRMLQDITSDPLPEDIVSNVV